MKVFAVGDIGIDLLWFAERQPRPGEEIGASAIEIRTGGNAANFATAAARLGLHVELVSILGKDAMSGFLLNEFRKQGMQTNFLKSRLGNAYSFIFVNKNGERAIASSKGALLELTAGKISKALLPKLKANDMVYFGAYFHLKGMHKGFAALLKSIRQRGCFIALDLCFDEHNEWKIKHLLKRIDLLLLNEVELDKVARGKSRKEKIRYLLSMGANAIVLKMGKKGAGFYCGGWSCHCPALRIKAVDSTGAGDAFSAGFIFAMLNGFDECSALMAGNFVAGEKTRRPDFAVPSAKEAIGFVLKTTE